MKSSKTMAWGLLGVFVVMMPLVVGMWVTSRPVVVSEVPEEIVSSPAPTAVERTVDVPRLPKRAVPKNQFVEKPNGEVGPLAEEAQETVDVADPGETEEDAAVAAWETLVEDFAASSDHAVTKESSAKVNKALKRLPRERRRESAQSLLNLVSDGDFGVMRDVLFDSAQPIEVIDAVFNDLLNRPDEVKIPLLEEIARDEAHANCVEARRILDVQKIFSGNAFRFRLNRVY